MKFLADALALLSAVALSIPAWYANRYGRLVFKMNLKNLRLGEPEFQAQYDELVRQMQELRDGWKPWKAWCFWIGTAAGVLAAAMLLWNGLYEPVQPVAH